MNYVIIVNSSPFHGQASLSAYHFANAVQQKGHKLLSIFFYQEGAYHASPNTVLQQDETDIGQLWNNFAQRYQQTLHLCSAAALRRGIIDEASAQLFALPISMQSNYKSIGLTQFLTLAETADRMISFA